MAPAAVSPASIAAAPITSTIGMAGVSMMRAVSTMVVVAAQIAPGQKRIGCASVAAGIPAIFHVPRPASPPCAEERKGDEADGHRDDENDGEVHGASRYPASSPRRYLAGS